MRGVARQMEAFKGGFNTVFPLSSMHGLLHPSEVRNLADITAQVVICLLVVVVFVAVVVVVDRSGI